MTPGPCQIIECPACGALHQLATAASGNTFGALLWSDGKLDAPMLFNSPDIARCSHCRALFMLELVNVVGELPAFPCCLQRLWRVTLHRTGTNRVSVMAVLRKHLAIDLAQAKRMLTALPTLVASGEGTANDGTDLIQDLLAAGAAATLDVTDEVLSSPTSPVPPEWTAAPLLPPLRELDFLEAVDSRLWSDRQSEVQLRTAAFHSGNDPFRQMPAAWQPWPQRQTLAASNTMAVFDLLAPEVPTENLLRAEIAREQERFDVALRIALATNVQETPAHARLAAELLVRARRRDSALFSVELANK